MNEFEEVIQKIRRGELILWVGSGFSKFAGYPTGSQLADIIKKKLNHKEKKHLKTKFNLDDVTEEFVQMRSRKELISILQEVFKKKPTKLTLHETISQIPQIQTIITTNYDKTFELVYGSDVSTFINDKDISASFKNKVALYKIHGDIDIPDSIIITKGNYQDYYKEKKENLLWNEIKSLISKNSILFIGYSFGDLNIQSLFEEILDRLGESHKDYYLITPSLPDYKKQFLLEKYSIRHISMSAEKAISNIKREVEINLIRDTENGFIHPHLIYNVYTDRKIDADFSIIKDGKTKLNTIRPLENGPQITSKISLTFPEEKSSKMNEFNEFLFGKKFGSYELSNEDCIIDVSVKIGDIIIEEPENNITNSLTFTSIPNRLFYADLLLSKSGISLNRLKGEGYYSSSAFKTMISHPCFDLTIKSSDIGKPVLTILLSLHPVENIIQGFECYHFLNAWIEDDELRIHFDYQNKPFIIPFKKLKFDEKQFGENIRRTYDLLSKIIRIRREFCISFDKLNQITNDDLSTLNRIIKLLDGGKLTLENILSYQTKILDKEQYLKLIDEGDFVLKLGPIQYPFTFLDTDITIDCNLFIYHGFVENKDEVISKLTEGFDEIDVTLKSKSDECFLVLRKDSSPQNPN